MKSVYSKVATAAALVAVAILVASCGDFKKTSVVSPPSSAGVDFSRYVSLGNSLVAGYESGALYESAQKYSYPNIIAQQAGIASGTSIVFNQPLISDPGFGIRGTTPVGRLQIVSLATNPPTIGPSVSASPVPINAQTVLQPYNNLGVPGAVLSDMLDTTSLTNPNPFFGIVLRSPAFGKSCVQQALALHPTFISVEVGDNDILGYATSGGTSAYNPPANFSQEFNLLMNTLMAGAPTAKFAVANIPDVTTIPYFTTILPFIYGPNGEPIVVDGHHIPMFVQRHDANGKLYVGPADTLHDFILLTAIDSLEAGAGSLPSHPMPDQFVLDSSEVATAEGVINAYNQTISGFAASNPSRVALVDVHSLLANIAQHGYVSDGMIFSSAFIQGGLFGLDGIHPTAQGYGIIANTFITAINSRFGSNIPLVAISSLPGSIVITNRALASSASKLPNITYQDLMPTLQLFQGDKWR